MGPRGALEARLVASGHDGAVASAPGDLRVVWVSASYGYGTDLLYFGELFRRFVRRFPATRVLVERNVAYRDADDLPLDPAISGLIIKRYRDVGQAKYDASVFIPSPLLAWRLLRSRPQAIICIEFTALVLLALAVTSLFGRTARLLLVESDPAARGGSFNPVVLAIKRWACRRADAIQTNTPAGKRFLTEVLRVPAAKVVVAPYLTSCPPKALVPDRKDDDRLRLLFVNSLSERKGPGQLMAALALLTPEVRQRLSLLMVGDGPERPALEAAAAAMSGLKVEFAGAQPYSALGRFYAQGDVLIIPSLADYRSLAGFEGLGFGLALIGSVHDGASAETIVGQGTGLCVDPLDHAALAEAITRLAEDRELLASCKARSAALFADRFDYDRIVDNLAGALGQAVTARLG